MVINMNNFFVALKYLRNFNGIENGIVNTLDINRDEYHNIGMESGKFLSFLIRLIKGKKILEIGSCIGYSSIWIGEAVKKIGGQLTTIEFDSAYYNEAKENITNAGLTDYTNIILGDAKAIIKEMEDETFDLVFQDSEKILYIDMYEDCIRVTKKNGLIVVDDALLKPFGEKEELVKPIHAFNNMVFQDNRLYSIMLPIGHGLVVSIKL